MFDPTIEDLDRLTAEETSPGEELRPATWLDLALYLAGGIGLYFLAGLLLGAFFSEVSLTVTVLSAALNFVVLSGSVYILGVRRRKLSWAGLGLTSASNRGREALIGAVLAVAIMPVRLLAGAMGLGIEWLITGEITSLDMRTGMFSVGFDTWYGVLLLLIGIGILAPIAEELFFRGLLYDFFRQKTGVRGAVAVSSLMFGLAHFDSLSVVLSSLVMGVVMALSVERTRSIWMAIWMHIATNSGAVLLMALIAKVDPEMLLQGL